MNIAEKIKRVAKKPLEILLAGSLAISPLACSANRIIDEHERDMSFETSNDPSSYEQKWVPIFKKPYLTKTVNVTNPNYLDFIITPVEETLTEFSSSTSGNKEYAVFDNDSITIFNKIYIPKKTGMRELAIRDTKTDVEYDGEERTVETIRRENPHNRLTDNEFSLAETRYFYFMPRGADKRAAGALPIYFLIYDGANLRENNSNREITVVGEVYRPVEISQDELHRLTQTQQSAPQQQVASSPPVQQQRAPTRNARHGGTRRTQRARTLVTPLDNSDPCQFETQTPSPNNNNFTAHQGNTIFADWCTVGEGRGFPPGHYNDYKEAFICINGRDKFSCPSGEGLIAGKNYQRPRTGVIRRCVDVRERSSY